MEQEIEKRVLALTKQHQDRMAEESGIQPSLTDEDMKEYLQQVIEGGQERKMKAVKKYRILPVIRIRH